MKDRDFDDDVDWDALVRESDGDLPDLPPAEILQRYREDKARGLMRESYFWRTVVCLIIAAGVVVLFASYAIPANAHDFWIGNSGYKAPTGEHCCGKNDCHVVLEVDVKITASGYLLSTGEVVPFAEAQQSEDEDYWRCKRYDGSRRCFFAPQPAS